MIGIIYKATSKTTGKYYIGYSIHSLRWRKTQHKNRSVKTNTHFYNAIKKYGWDDFSWSIIEEMNTDIKELKQKEIFYINKFDTYKNGYNSTKGGDGAQYFLGKTFSEKHKERIKQSLLGHKVSDKTKQKISEAKKGHKHSEETKERIKLSAINNPDYGMRNKKQSTKAKIKMSKSAKKRFENSENNPMYGKYHSDESKKKMSDSHKNNG